MMPTLNKILLMWAGKWERNGGGHPASSSFTSRSKAKPASQKAHPCGVKMGPRQGVLSVLDKLVYLSHKYELMAKDHKNLRKSKDKNEIN